MSSICPKCNGEKGVGGYISVRTVRGRKYRYWVHQQYVDGKRIVKYCYLGPVEEEEKKLKLKTEELEVELLEVFKDVQLRYVAKSTRDEGKPGYKREYEIIPKTPHEPITIEKLKAYAEKLNQQISNYKFYLEEVYVKGNKYHVIRRSDKPIDIEKLENMIHEYNFEIEVQKRVLTILQRELNEMENEHGKIKSEIEKLQREHEQIAKSNIIKKVMNYSKMKKLQREIANKNITLTYIEGKIKAYTEKIKDYTKTLNEYEAKYKSTEKELETLKEKMKIKGKPWLPIYFDLEKQKVYIEKNLWEKEPKLYTYVLHRCLGYLGIATTRHITYIH